MAVNTLLSRNPATGEIIREIPTTDTQLLPLALRNAEKAQSYWRHQSIKQRARSLINLREVLLDQADEVSELISAETGKPLFESLMNEVMPSLDALSFFARRGPKTLRDRDLPLGWMLHRKGYLNHWPIGIIAIIAPWNYPFVIPFSQIIMAILAGNAVIFKPSELTSCTGLKIQELFDQAGFPSDLLQTVIGDASVGAALIQNKPGKIFFTGSPATGKKIMTAAAQHLIPLVLELGGKDPMIILPDADLDFATSAALWGGFSNSGQMCASTERLILHEKIAEPFLFRLKEKMARLKYVEAQQPHADLGVLTFENQKTVLKEQITEAKSQGLTVEGGKWLNNDKTLEPTLVSGPKVENLNIYQRESFGPIIAVTSFKTVKEAIQKANQNQYGLSASIITKNILLGEEIAKQLEVGTVTLNEVAYTYAQPQAPWGGLKDSGFGKSHSEAGLLEFVHTRSIHKPRFGPFFFKSFWWFPYSQGQYLTIRAFIELYRKNWIDKLKGLSRCLWQFIHVIKKEKRL